MTDTPALSPDEARALLRECATVVAPGETLVIRAADTWTPKQVHDVQNRLREIIADRELGFTVLLVPGEEFAVAGREPAPAAVQVTGGAVMSDGDVDRLVEKIRRRLRLGGEGGAFVG